MIQSKEKNKVKLAVVGLLFGEHLVREIALGRATSTVQLCGVYDLNEDLSNEVAERYESCVYASFDAILEDPEIEAVGLFTPPGNRADLILQIIRAGKHVMTTKPFELDAEAAHFVLMEARKLKKVVHLNSPSALPDPETRQILDWQKCYSLGEPIAVRWETYSPLREKADGRWYDDPERCPAAPIFRLGIYGINQLLRLCGKVSAVHVMHSRIFTERPTADNAALSLRFANGALGSVFASFCIDDGQRLADLLTIYYERGSVHISASDVDESFFVTAKKMALRVRQDDGTLLKRQVSISDYGPLNNYQWEYFYKAIRQGGGLEGEATIEQIVHSVQIIEAMRESDRCGREVTICKSLV